MFCWRAQTGVSAYSCASRHCISYYENQAAERNSLPDCYLRVFFASIPSGSSAANFIKKKSFMYIGMRLVCVSLEAQGHLQFSFVWPLCQFHSLTLLVFPLCLDHCLICLTSSPSANLFTIAHLWTIVLPSFLWFPFTSPCLFKLSYRSPCPLRFVS